LLIKFTTTVEGSVPDQVREESCGWSLSTVPSSEAMRKLGQRGMNRRDGVCIIGGGAIGASLACHLGLLGAGAGVRALEPDAGYLFTSAARSAAALRVQFNLAANVALSLASAEFFANAHHTLSVDGRPVDIGFQPAPYIILSGREGLSRMRRAYQRQVACGAQVRWIESGELSTAVPWLGAEGVSAATPR
jgi:FAD-dependent oxidoreductase domain-containing protein 1